MCLATVKSYDKTKLSVDNLKKKKNKEKQKTHMLYIHVCINHYLLNNFLSTLWNQLSTDQELIYIKR